MTFHLTRTSESGSETSKDEFDPDMMDSFSRRATPHQGVSSVKNMRSCSVQQNCADPLAAVTADRRGSAPCDLLMNQINKIAATAAVVAVAGKYKIYNILGQFSSLKHLKFGHTILLVFKKL